MNIIEVTEKNKEYVKQIAELEDVVLEKMVEEGREGQLFTTGYDDILDYAQSDENSVFIMENEGKVESATYITQGQLPYTYNDLTKYFKMSDDYKKYVARGYSSRSDYFSAMNSAYITKVVAYKLAAKRILAESDFESIQEYLEHEIKDNGFHEKSKLRDGLLKYMAQYVQSNYRWKDQIDYDKFFFCTYNDLRNAYFNQFLGTIVPEPKLPFYQYALPNIIVDEATVEEMELVLKAAFPQVFEINVKDMEKYYNATTTNTVEIDTYITNPESKNKGNAKIIVFEGIKKHIEKFFKVYTWEDEMYLVSTLHRDNFPSKYVSEFFGLVDNLFVNRRQGRDREVHILRITRANYKSYLEKMAAKLAALYGYNPDGTEFSPELLTQVKREHYEYEKREIERLKSIQNLGVNAQIKDLKINGLNRLK